MFDYQDNRFRYSTWSQLAIILFLCGAGILLSGFISLGFAASYLHVPFEKLSEALQNSTDGNLLRLIQVISTFFFLALPAIIFSIMMSRHPFKYIGFNEAVSRKQIFIIIGILLAGLAVSGSLSTINEMIPISKSAEKYFKSLEDNYNKQVMAIANMKTFKDYILSLFIIALLPALFEEMLFRGTLQPVVINLTKNAFTGILITSILFSAIHISYYGFLPRLALGFIIGYVFYYSRNLWLASITHFLYNAFGVTQLYLISRKGLLTPEAMNDDSFSIYYGLPAAIALYIIFILFKKESNAVTASYNLQNK